MNKNTKTLSIILWLLAVITFVILYGCSFYTHPGWRILAFDQDIFYVIGRNWANGNIPYLTAWDSKGPIIFLYNMLGYMLTKNELGIFLLQFVNMLLVVWFCYFSTCKYCKKQESILYTICFLASYTIINSGGNQVGDCTLLLSTITIFLTYRWSRDLQEGKISHPWKYAIAYGMFFAACLFSRLTNAMVLCASILVIICVLVYHRQWKNIVHNTLAFMLGVSIITTPFIIYFYCHHAWQDMWYATVLYNIEYALHSHPAGVVETHFPVIYFILYNISMISILFFSIVAFACNDRKKIAYVWFPITLITIGWILKSYANANYTISFLPILMISLIELSTLYRKKQKPIALYTICTLCIICTVGIINYVKISYSSSVTKTEIQKNVYHQEKMIRCIPQNESFILYNGLPYIYAKYNIKPYYPYWVCQDWAIENGLSLQSKVRECYKNGNVKWIIAYDYQHSNIKDILLERYTIQQEDKSGKLTLFRLKESS